jgi:ribosomal protein S18 acetylase RimI-like enzyme
MFRNIKDQLDNPAVREILAASIYMNSLDAADKKLDECRNSPNLNLYGWIENDEILGVCYFKGCQTSHLEILNIAVAETSRGCGIGCAMINALYDEFLLPIEAETDDDAVDFYRKTGFITIEFQKHGGHRWKCVYKRKY